MRFAKNFAAALVIVLALSFTSFAGDQQTPGYVQPPPPPAASADTNSTDCQVNAAVLEPAAIVETSGDLFFEALAVLLSVY